MNKVYFITYHYVRPIKNSKYPNLKGLELNKFVNQLDLLQKKFHIINYDDLCALIKKKKKNYFNKDLCVLTFDDGYKDCIKYVLPELKKRNLSALFFPTVNSSEKKQILDVNKIQFLLAKQKSTKKIYDIIYQNLPTPEIKEIKNYKKKFINKHPYDSKNISFLKSLLSNFFYSKKILDILFKKFVTKNFRKFAQNLYLSKNDLINLHKNGMFIGCHGTNHIHLNQIKKNEINREISNNILFLKKLKIFKKDWIMCYPYGSYNKSTISIIKKKKCFLGLTINAGINYLNKINKYEIKRIDCNEVRKLCKS